jgi:hypothetical protein
MSQVNDPDGVLFSWYNFINNYSSTATTQGTALTPSSSILDTFFIDDSILNTEVSQSNRVFTVATSNLLIPDVSGSSTFVLNMRTRSDDGVQVWIDSGSGYQQVISRWNNHGPTNDTASINVPDNSVLPIKVYYTENGGGALLDVQWDTSSGGTSYSRIAQNYLYLAPNITSTEVTSINEDSAYSYTFATTQPAQISTADTFSSITLPSWLTFNSGTGVLSGTPTNSAVGNNNVTLRATDSFGNASDQTFVIAVATLMILHQSPHLRQAVLLKMQYQAR